MSQLSVGAHGESEPHLSALLFDNVSRDPFAPDIHSTVMDPDKSLMLARIWWRASPNLRALLSDILALSPDEHRHFEPDIHALLAIRRRELHKRDARQAEERSPEEAR